MKNADYEEAVYTAKLVVSKRVSDWAVSHEAIVVLATALVKADERLKTVTASLREIVARRDKAIPFGNTADGSDGRYARARAALKALEDE